MFEPIDDRYGVEMRAIGTVKDGQKCRLTFYTEPEPMAVEMYHYMHGFYERAAKEAGISDLKWHPIELPEDERKYNGYWDVNVLRPHMTIVTARRL